MRNGKQANSINIIASGKAGRDNVIVNFTGKSEGFDKLQNFNKSIAKIYVSDKGKAYGIVNVDENTTEVEFVFSTQEMGQYSISLDINGDLGTVYLLDRVTGAVTDMSSENRYDFIATSNDIENRFVIMLDNSQQTTDNSHFAYISNNEIIISNIEGIAQINIYDVMGRCMYNGECSDATSSISTDAFTSGVYMIHKVDDSGTNVQKIIID